MIGVSPSPGISRLPPPSDGSGSVADAEPDEGDTTGSAPDPAVIEGSNKGAKGSTLAVCLGGEHRMDESKRAANIAARVPVTDPMSIKAPAITIPAPSACDFLLDATFLL